MAIPFLYRKGLNINKSNMKYYEYTQANYILAIPLPRLITRSSQNHLVTFFAIQEFHCYCFA